MKRVLVTGANGFVGHHLCGLLRSTGFLVRGAVRVGKAAHAATESAAVSDIDGDTSWVDALQGVDLVVHCAARVHVLRDDPAGDALYFSTNTEGSAHLAREAARLGVRRIVYLSSVKVLGEATHDRSFQNADPPAPKGAYAQSKRMAEVALRQIAEASGLEVAIVRPPLIYGPGVRANFLRMMNWVSRGLPVPVGAIQNLRSMAFVGNVNDLIRHLLLAPALPKEPLLVSDGEDLSTAELAKRLASAMQVRARIWPISPSLLRNAARIVGRLEEFERIAESLRVDISRTSAVLQWRPPVSADEGIVATANWFQRHGTSE
jgi:nucleoside-diphosphate-sugar epimerase